MELSRNSRHMTKLLLFSCSGLYALHLLTTFCSSSTLSSQSLSHGLPATFISGASLSGLAVTEILCVGLLRAFCLSHLSHLIHPFLSHSSHPISFIQSHLVSGCIVLCCPICSIVFVLYMLSLRSLFSIVAAIHGPSIVAHLTGFKPHYIPGSMMGFYPAPEQPKVSPYSEHVVDIWANFQSGFPTTQIMGDA